MLINPHELVRQQPADAWFCLRSQPKREHIAAGGLRRIEGVEVFCPRIRYRKPTARGPVWFVEATFPGYLFARFDYATLRGLVRSANGITGLVHFGENIAILPAAAVEILRARVTDGDEVTVVESTISTGDTVEIVDGPLRGIEAVVTRVIPPRQRVELLLDFLGRELRAEVPETFLISPRNPRMG
jgi:transcription antitermination factor NusG